MAAEGKASLSKTVVSKLAVPEYRGTPESRRLGELSMEVNGTVEEMLVEDYRERE